MKCIGRLSPIKCVKKGSIKQVVEASKMFSDLVDCSECVSRNLTDVSTKSRESFLSFSVSAKSRKIEQNKLNRLRNKTVALSNRLEKDQFSFSTQLERKRASIQNTQNRALLAANKKILADLKNLQLLKDSMLNYKRKRVNLYLMREAKNRTISKNHIFKQQVDHNLEQLNFEHKKKKERLSMYNKSKIFKVLSYRAMAIISVDSALIGKKNNYIDLHSREEIQNKREIKLVRRAEEDANQEIKLLQKQRRLFKNIKLRSPEADKIVGYY